MVTRQEAIDMRDAIRQLEQSEAATVRAKNDADMVIALAWWNTVKLSVPQTRDEALTAYRFIEQLLNTETDRLRLAILRKKLLDANEKYKERKRNG